MDLLKTVSRMGLNADQLAIRMFGAFRIEGPLTLDEAMLEIHNTEYLFWLDLTIDSACLMRWAKALTDGLDTARGTRIYVQIHMSDLQPFGFSNVWSRSARRFRCTYGSVLLQTPKDLAERMGCHDAYMRLAAAMDAITEDAYASYRLASDMRLPQSLALPDGITMEDIIRADELEKMDVSGTRLAWLPTGVLDEMFHAVTPAHRLRATGEGPCAFAHECLHSEFV